MSNVKIITFATAFGILYFLLAFWFGYWLGGFGIPFLGFSSVGYLTLRFRPSKMVVAVNSVFLILLLWYGLCHYLPIFIFIGKPSFFIYHFLSSIIIISHIIFLSFHHKELDLKKPQEMGDLSKRIRLAKNLSRNFMLILVIFVLLRISGTGDVKERSFPVPIKNIQLEKRRPTEWKTYVGGRLVSSKIIGGDNVVVKGMCDLSLNLYGIEHKDGSASLSINYDPKSRVIYGNAHTTASKGYVYIGTGGDLRG